MPPARQARALAALTALAAVLVSVGCGVESGSPGSTAGDRADPPAASSSTRPATPAAPRRAPGSPLRGVTVGIDPGHNGGNADHPEVIGRQIWNGRDHEDCNTTGTSTDGGYPEWRFTFAVGSYLAHDLRRAGARVVLTHSRTDGAGPCVDRRARIIDRAHADVAIDIHADGGPDSGRGFAILQPVASGTNDAVVRPSRRYAALLRKEFLTTGMPTSTYDGVDGLTTRTDLAGLNLTTVPQVLIECGNMRNADDAALLTSPRFQRKAARAIMAAMVEFLRTRR